MNFSNSQTKGGTAQSTLQRSVYHGYPDVVRQSAPQDADAVYKDGRNFLENMKGKKQNSAAEK